MRALFAEEIGDLVLPDSTNQAMPGIQWGHFDEFFTPAYWAAQAWMAARNGQYRNYRLGENLIEEVAACLLGGYGMVSELGLAAYAKVRDAGILSCRSPSQTKVCTLLREPLLVDGRVLHYRYPQQRSRYLCDAVTRLHNETPPQSSDTDFRNWLLTFPGIGPKTASWITRNWLNSDNVAVIDVHIHRAGLLMGLFGQEHQLPRHYFEMEDRFLRFATAIGAQPAVLDNLMWQHMRSMNGIALDTIRALAIQSSFDSSPRIPTAAA